MNDAAVALAYKHCERITRSRARNFYYGIRLLPPRKRAAMCALYAMARRIDDVGDSVALSPAPGRAARTSTGPHGLERDEPDQGEPNRGEPNRGEPESGPEQDGPVQEGKAAALDDIRRSLSLLAKSSSGLPAATLPPGDPVLAALADTAGKFPLPIHALEELVEGCSWDLAGRRYQTFDELVEYCRRVAGTIGRLSLAIYGSSDPEQAEPLADALGVALQLTNILRDLVEDREVMGRVYLPAEDLERFGVSAALEGAPDDLAALICFESGRAEAWYERGLELLPMLDSRSRACTGAMAGIYHRLLDRIRSRPESVLSGRLSLSPVEKGRVALTALARAAA
ncbi:MAG TPA: phytoene/squalene synthase family protein [Acidimicrobiales bacterium]|nr:phytoene/squalene synthase family protein [Acidimicrobiales bacterium]